MFCMTADYTPQALNPMTDNPNTDRRSALEDLLAATGGNSSRCTAGPPLVLAR
jgi:hypothetical protein